MHTWHTLLRAEKEKPYFLQILNFLRQERQQGKVIYPAQENIFNAFKLTPFAETKVVILGQDPYHGPGQAHGLCFSVLPGVPFPPSLQNIFKELQTDCQIPFPTTGCLQPWANQGVLLLNTVLTVEAGKPYSHDKIGWEHFTDEVMRVLNEYGHQLIFLLWGSHAQKKGETLDSRKHFILKATHPSPLSAHRGFLGCHHFSKTNVILQKIGKRVINWNLS